MSPKNKIDVELKNAMDASLKAYSNGSEQFFSYFTTDARIYAPESTAEPIVGREAFARGFGRTLASVKRKVKVVCSDIQVRGDHAVVAQVLQMETNGVMLHVRQSVVWERDEKGAWLMSHVHNTLVGQPVVSEGIVPLTAKSVQVLNERIATVAASVGLAQ